MIRVLVVDDHPIVRQGVKEILTEAGDMRVDGEAENSAQAVAAVRDSEWDVVVLDINLPDRNGIETLKLIRELRPALPVVMLSIHAESHIVSRALKGGASGYVTKQGVPDQLVTAVRQVQSGRRYLSPALAEALADMIGVDPDKPAHELLSQREFQTLQMIASGKSPAEIASALQLSVKTVSVYRARLLEKLKLRSNAELTHYGIKHRLVDFPHVQ